MTRETGVLSSGVKGQIFELNQLQVPDCNQKKRVLRDLLSLCSEYDLMYSFFNVKMRWETGENCFCCIMFSHTIRNGEGKLLHEGLSIIAQ